jgi:hypothetical protein
MGCPNDLGLPNSLGWQIIRSLALGKSAFCRARHPGYAAAGGLWLCRVRPSGLRAVVVPSAFSVISQPGHQFGDFPGVQGQAD